MCSDATASEDSTTNRSTPAAVAACAKADTPSAGEDERPVDAVEHGRPERGRVGQVPGDHVDVGG